jgi:deoxyribonuclease V
VKEAAASSAHDALVVCVDVDYRDPIAVAAGVWFPGWETSEVETEVVTTLDEVAPYQPGELYRRELPCVLAVLERGPVPEVVVVDGYVWLGPERPGLGAHLYWALGERTVVVGVAKSRFVSATAVLVHRGDSHSPLYVTAAGVSAEEAAGVGGENARPLPRPHDAQAGGSACAGSKIEATDPMKDLRILFTAANPGYLAHLADAEGNRLGVEVPFTPFLDDDDCCRSQSMRQYPLG